MSKGPGTCSTSLVTRKDAHGPDGRPPSAPLAGDSGVCLFFSETIVPTDARTLRLLRDEGWEEGSRARWPDSGSAPAGGCAQLEASSLLVRSRPGLASSPAPSGKHGPEVLATQLSLDSRMDPALVRRSWRLSRAKSRSICLQKGCYRDRAHS